MSSQCTPPPLPDGVEVVDSQSIYNFNDTIVYTCEKHELLEGDLVRACLPGGTWNGTEPLCGDPDSKEQDDNDARQSLYIGLGILAASLVVIAFLAIDFLFHIRRRQRSKRYQKRRTALLMGYNPANQKRPRPFIITPQIYSGTENKGYNHENDDDNIDSSINYQDSQKYGGVHDVYSPYTNVPGHLPPLSLDSPKKTKKKKKEKQPSNEDKKIKFKLGKKSKKTKKISAVGSFDGHTEASNDIPTDSSRPTSRMSKNPLSPSGIATNSLGALEDASSDEQLDANESYGFIQRPVAISRAVHPPTHLPGTSEIAYASSTSMERGNFTSSTPNANHKDPPFLPDFEMTNEIRPTSNNGQNFNNVAKNKALSSRPLPAPPVYSSNNNGQHDEPYVEVHDASYRGIHV